MRLCVVSFKECWQDEAGRWMSDGGFPLQMDAIASLFDATTLVVVAGHPRPGGIPLPAHARVVALPRPVGEDWRRKLSVVRRAPCYLAAMAREFRSADAVHVPLPGDLPLLGMYAALWMGKPLVARYGGSWVPNGTTTLMNRVTRTSMRLFAGGTNVMLATGEGDRPPAPGVTWIFSTALSRAELAAIDAAVDRPLGSPPRAVYLGRLSPEKGVHVLLRALGELAAADPAACPDVTIAGDGIQRRELERLASTLRYPARLEFAGQVPRSEIGALLSGADLCIQPSLTEGFSKAWLDAMAHGVPVLASRVGAAPAVIGAPGERGWLVPPGDVAALAVGIRTAWTWAKEWPALRCRCRTYVEERTLERWAAEIGARCEAAWGRPLRSGGSAR